MVAPVAQAFAHHMTQQQSLPGSPLLQSPIPIPQHGTGTQIIYGTPTAIQATQPLTQVQPGLYTVASAAPHATFDPSLSVSGNFVSINSTVLRTPMSSLSCQIASDAKFPDPSHLESAPASKVNMELFHRGLTEPWNQYNNQIQQQVSSSLFSLSLSLSLNSHSLSLTLSLSVTSSPFLFPSLSRFVASHLHSVTSLSPD